MTRSCTNLHKEHQALELGQGVWVLSLLSAHHLAQWHCSAERRRTAAPNKGRPRHYKLEGSHGSDKTAICLWRWREWHEIVDSTLVRRHHPQRIRRLRKNLRDNRCRMAQVCRLSVFATRRHGRKLLNLVVAKNALDSLAAQHHAEQSAPFKSVVDVVAHAERVLALFVVASQHFQGVSVFGHHEILDNE